MQGHDSREIVGLITIAESRLRAEANSLATDVLATAIVEEANGEAMLLADVVMG